jgi:hypothetical protein
MRLILSLTLLILCAVRTEAQDYVKRPWMPLESRIGLALGIGSVTYLDKNSSPLIYHSRPKNLRIFYNLESNSFLFSVDLDVRMGSNAPKYHRDRTLFFQEEDYKGKQEDKKFPAGGSFLAGRISLGAYYKISSTQESTFKVAVGGRIMNELFYPQGWNTGGIFNALSFSPEALTQHRVNEHHQFTASVRIPLLVRLSRLPYDNTVSAPDKNQLQGFFRNSTWVGPTKFLAPAMSIGYNYQLTTRWSAGLNYEFGWYNMQTPQQMKAISQSILANFHHQF